MPRRSINLKSSINVDPETLKAISGPREEKTPGSPEWCRQTVAVLEHSWRQKVMTDAEWDRLISEIEQYEAWKVLGFNSLDELLESRIGVNSKTAKKQLGDPHRPTLEESNNPNIVRVNQHGNAVDYILARLERDRNPLAEKVSSGELSANAAAIQAGFRKRTISIPEDPQRAAASVIRNFGQEFAQEMKRFL